MLLRYQDKEERAPAALRLRGGLGAAPPDWQPAIAGLSLAAMAPARRARVRARAAEGACARVRPVI